MIRATRPVGCAFVLAGLLLVLGCGRGERTPSPEVSSEAALILPADPKKGPTQQTVTFLGSQGTGRRFCIVADCSQSLSPASFGLIKKEIARTIESLDDTSQVFVVFFADKAYPMPGGDWGTKKDLEMIKAWMHGLSRIFKTLPVPAFKLASGLKPPPDVIFLMTDGMLQPAGAADRITELNKDTKAIINTILFTKTAEIVPPESKARLTLERIAKQNDGTYTQFVDPDALPAKKKKKKA